MEVNYKAKQADIVYGLGMSGQKYDKSRLAMNFESVASAIQRTNKSIFPLKAGITVPYSSKINLF